MELVFLHGALGCANHWNSIATRFDGHSIHLLDFPGHGQSNLAAAYSLEALSDFLAGYITDNHLSNPVIIGYSMGGYVALHGQLNSKFNASRIVTIGTKFKWNEEIAVEETSRLNWDTMGVIREKLTAEHGVNLDALFDQTTAIMMGIGKNPLTAKDLNTIKTNVDVMVGERDRMVTAEESQLAADALPNGRFHLLANQPHLLEKVDGELLFETLRQLLS